MASFRYPSQGFRAGSLSSSAYPLLAPDGSASAPSYSFASAPTAGGGYDTTSGRYWVKGVTASAAGISFFSNSFLCLGSGTAIGWGTNASALLGSIDTNLIRQAAGSLGLHNNTSSSAQLSIFNTRTDASNYESLECFWTGNVAIIRTAAAGSGTARNLDIRYGGTTSPALTISTAVNDGIDVANLTSSTTSSIYVLRFSTTFTGTTGTRNYISLTGSLTPSGSATAEYRYLNIAGTINYASGGAGRVQLIRLAPTNTALPTGLNGSIVLASTASALGGEVFFNTSDETTNYEYVYQKFSSDVWEVGSIKGGSGTLRGIRIGITGNSVGFLGATPVARASHIADPSGGAIIDSESRTAIAAINVVLENLGFVATS